MENQPTRYYVTTWDADAQKYTPQKGVSRGPYSLWQLKRALRKLQGLGYDCHRMHDGDSDASVLVTSDDVSPKRSMAEMRKIAREAWRRYQRRLAKEI